MTFTDGTHLVSSNLKELHEFAEKIGLKKEWFQNKKYPHYDLTSKKIVGKARKNGAGFMASRTIIKSFHIGLFKKY